MPVIDTLAVGIELPATTTLDQSPGTASASPALMHPVLFGLSIGCASLTAVLSCMFVWTCLKRRKKSAEMKSPASVPPLSSVEVAEPRRALDLDLEQGKLELPDIVVTSPRGFIVLNVNEESVLDSESDSEPSLDIPSEDSGDFDFKCRGPDCDYAIDFDISYHGNGSPVETIHGMKRHGMPTIVTSLLPVLNEEDEVDNVQDCLGMANLMVIEEEEEFEESLDIIVPIDTLGANVEMSTDTGDEDTIEKCDEEPVDSSAEVGLDEEVRKGIDTEEALVLTECAQLAYDVQATQSITLACSFEEDATKDDGKKPGICIDDNLQENNQTKSNEQALVTSTESMRNSMSVKRVDRIPQADIMDELNGNDNDIATSKPAESEIKDGSNYDVATLEARLPVTSSPSDKYEKSAELATKSAKETVLVSSKDKEALTNHVQDEDQMKSFLFIAEGQELCLKKEDHNERVAPVVDEHNVEEKKNAETDEQLPVCVAHVEKPFEKEKEEMDAITMASGETILQKSESPSSHCEALSNATLDLANDVPSVVESPKPRKITSVINGDEPSQNGQCTPAWWEVLEKIKQDPTCNGSELFREWAVKNGISSSKGERKPRWTSLAKKPSPKPASVPAPAPPSSQIHSRKASMPKDREAIKRDCEKRFLEWWAAGNEAIFGPLETKSELLSRESSSQGEVVDEGCKLRESDISAGESSEYNHPADECRGVLRGEEAYHSSVRSSSSVDTLGSTAWSKSRSEEVSPSKQKSIRRYATLVPSRLKINTSPDASIAPRKMLSPPSALRQAIPSPDVSASPSAKKGIQTCRPSGIFSRPEDGCNAVQKIKEPHQGSVKSDSSLIAVNNPILSSVSSETPKRKSSSTPGQVSMSPTKTSSPRVLQRARAPSLAVTSTPIAKSLKYSGSPPFRTPISLTRNASSPLTTPSGARVSRALPRPAAETPAKPTRIRSMSTASFASPSPRAKADMVTRQRQSVASPPKPAWGSPPKKTVKTVHRTDKPECDRVSRSSLSPSTPSTPKARKVLSGPSTLANTGMKVPTRPLNVVDSSDKENVKHTPTARLSSRSGADVDSPTPPTGKRSSIYRGMNRTSVPPSARTHRPSVSSQPKRI